MTLDEPLRACLADILLPAPRGGTLSVLGLPNSSAPRVLLPVDDPRAAARAVRRHFARGSWQRHLRTTALSALVSTGAASHLARWKADILPAPQHRFFPQWLNTALPHPHRIGMVLIGPQRANRKPVVLVSDRSGALIAVAKLGYNEVTRPLVRHEASALSAVASALGQLAHVPALIASGESPDVEALLMRALPELDRRRQMSRPELVALVRAISAAASPGRSDLADAVAHPRMKPLAHIATRLRSLQVPFGGAHGDMHSGNLGIATDGRPAIWDWERWSQGVPLGFDLLHYDFQSWVTTRTEEPTAAARRLIRMAPGILSPLGVSSDLAPDVARDYLIRIAARYVGDAQDKAGSRLGAVEEWLFPAVLDEYNDKEER